MRDFVGTTEHHKDTVEIKVEMLIHLLDLPNNCTFIHENSAGTTNDSSIRYNEMTTRISLCWITSCMRMFSQIEWKLGYLSKIIFG